MLQAVLLDLDNTLILFDELAFYGRFFHHMVPYFDDILAPDDLQRRIVTATVSLKSSGGPGTNRERFMTHFAHGLERAEADLWQRFMRFYENDYHDFGIPVTVADGLAEVMDHLNQEGLLRVIATNPIFPAIAQRIRLSWAGLHDGDVDLVTHIENCRHIKPHSDYYREICTRIGVAPHLCLMVGNDPVNDMAAARAGLKTYLSTDADPRHFTMQTRSAEDASGVPAPDFSGPLAGVPEAVRRCR